MIIDALGTENKKFKQAAKTLDYSRSVEKKLRTGDNFYNSLDKRRIQSVSLLLTIFSRLKTKQFKAAEGACLLNPTAQDLNTISLRIRLNWEQKLMNCTFKIFQINNIDMGISSKCPKQFQ